jgi:hypothetical protein
VQTAVDSKHHLIVAHEVTNAPGDRGQLASMAGQARAALDAKTLTVIADPGYYKGEEILECYEAGIKALVPKVDTSESKAKGRYGKADFRYDADRDEYVCPAGQRLTYRFDSVEHGKTLWVYMTYQCSSCPLQAQCTTGNARRIKRWEHEHLLEGAEAELKKHPDALFNETISKCSDRDEPACARLQSQARHQRSRCAGHRRQAAGGLRGRFCAFRGIRLHVSREKLPMAERREIRRRYADLSQ